MIYSYFLVGLGGAIGSVARYGAGQLVSRWWPGAFPFGTMAVNIFGSLLMGLLVGVLARLPFPWSENARLLVAVGLLGGFTTFSAFSLEAIALAERGALAQMALYVLGSVGLGFLSLYVGLMAIRGAA